MLLLDHGPVRSNGDSRPARRPQIHFEVYSDCQQLKSEIGGEGGMDAPAAPPRACWRLRPPRKSNRVRKAHTALGKQQKPDPQGAGFSLLAERVGWTAPAAPPRALLATASPRKSNRVRKPIPHSASNKKPTRKGPVFCCWRRGWDGRAGFAATCLLATASLRKSNRVRKPIPHSASNKKPTRKGPVFCCWRRGWDSNPRRAMNPCWFSRPVHSTALPPLR